MVEWTGGDLPTFVTHLECSLTGERYPADTAADALEGRPAAVGALRSRRRPPRAAARDARRPAADPLALSRAVAGAPAGECGLARRGGDAADPAAAHCRPARRRRDPGQGRGPPADRLVQGARAGARRVDGQGARGQRRWRCRPTAMPGRRWRPTARAPASRPMSSVPTTRRRSMSARSRCRAPRCFSSTG